MRVLASIALLASRAVMASDALLGADSKTWAPSAKDVKKPAMLGEDSATYSPIPMANVTSRRALASAGCNSCCMENDCSLAFSQSQPGVCCGSHKTRGQIGCCPMGASCVPCANIWKCTMSRAITQSAMCRICSDDMPPQCMYSHRGYGGYGGYGHHGTSLSSLLFLLILLGCISMMFCSRGMDDVVMVQQPQMVMGPNGQPMMVQGQPMYGGYGGGYGYGGGDVAGAAATGFVGGMLVGEMMDHGDHGMGYGGYGGGFGGGGYGGDMGGGDMGFGADQ